MKFNHIGIFCNNLKSGKDCLKDIVQIKRETKTFLDKNLAVKVKFFFDKEKICYELVSPYGKKNPVSKILKKKDKILNHIAYTSERFDKDIETLRKKGFTPLIYPTKAKAFNGRRICFFLTPLNFIVELIVEKKN